HIVDFWRSRCPRFVFVVKHGKEELRTYIETLGIAAEFTEPRDLRGIADGLMSARSRLTDRFVVILGDCLFQGHFHLPPDLRLGLGIQRHADAESIHRSYLVELDDSESRIRHVEEKPKILKNNLLGLGFYFLDTRVFPYIERTPPSSLRNEVEITDVMEHMIKAGEPFSPVFFEGGYLNVTYAEDIDRAGVLLLSKDPPKGHTS
ncbi:MAG TPA: sugar phosphate nucleotidyltransferase, partial [Candidatus Ozemobacteraceae bacterium]|nr:sugar phosphate nucleotidyltransferase [Candidatus Ozemobacteraceae bacterium]